VRTWPVALASLGPALLCHCERTDMRMPAPVATATPDVNAEPVEVSRPAITATAATSAVPSSIPTVKCARDETFPSPWKVPEASAAAEVELRPGVREILVIGDSGRKGAAMAWSRASGTRALVLPLDDKASDDLEGMAWQKDTAGACLDTLTSSGAVRTFVPDGKGGLRADGETYRLGAPPISCADLHGINCGKNWEGLCLRSPTAHARCAGYAASKTETALYCVLRDDMGHLSVDPLRLPMVLKLDRLTNREGVLSDCAFGAPGGPAEDLLLVTTNVFGGSQTYLVDEATGRASSLDVQATLSNEAIAVDHDGVLYAFLDDNGEVSSATRFVCEGWGR
jgi:hypothetical protein